MIDRLLTPLEAAKRLSISPRTIQTWLWKGTLKGIKAGRLWRIRERDLEVFLDPMYQALQAAPLDDEPWTEEDERDVQVAERAIRQGRFKSWEEVKKELKD